MEADEWGDLPLFPLDTVLFPRMVLPLHIFEERYKLMINRCLEEERPFGVLLATEGGVPSATEGGVPSATEGGAPSGAEGGALRGTEGAGTPYRVGTTTTIARVSRMDDGRMNLVTIGNERFRLLDVRHGGAYPVGTAQPWPISGEGESEAREQVEPVRSHFRQYLALLDKAEGHKISISTVPDDPHALALLVAIALQVPKPQKQRFLEQASLAEMLALEQVILKREQFLLDYVIRTQQEQWEGGYSGFLALN